MYTPIDNEWRFDVEVVEDKEICTDTGNGIIWPMPCPDPQLLKQRDIKVIANVWPGHDIITLESTITE